MSTASKTSLSNRKASVTSVHSILAARRKGSQAAQGNNNRDSKSSIHSQSVNNWKTLMRASKQSNSKQILDSESFRKRAGSIAVGQFKERTGGGPSSEAESRHSVTSNSAGGPHNFRRVSVALRASRRMSAMVNQNNIRKSLENNRKNSRSPSPT